MVDALALKQIFSIESAAWAVVALLFLFLVRVWSGAPAIIEQWIAYKRAKAEEKADDWRRWHEEIERLRKQRNEDQDRANERYAAQEQENQKCRDDLAAAIRRISELEGYNDGRGKANQEAAGIVALERMGRNLKKPEAPDD